MVSAVLGAACLVYLVQNRNTRPPRPSAAAQTNEKPTRLLAFEELTRGDLPTFVILKKPQLIPFAKGTHATLIKPTTLSDVDDAPLREGNPGETFEVVKEDVNQRVLYCVEPGKDEEKPVIHFDSLSASCDASETVSADTRVEVIKIKEEKLLVRLKAQKFWVDAKETDVLELASLRRMRREAVAKRVQQTYQTNRSERERVQRSLKVERQKQVSRASQSKEDERQRRIAEAGPAPKCESGEDGAYPEVLQYLKEKAKNPQTVRCYRSEAPVFAMYPGGEAAQPPIVYGSKVFRNQLQFGWVVGCDYSEEVTQGGIIRLKRWFFIQGGKVIQSFFDKDSFYKGDE